MLQILSEIKQRTADENVLLGDREARELRSQLPWLNGQSPTKQLIDHWKLGWRNELRLGNNEAAIEHLNVVREFLPQVRREHPQQFPPRSAEDILMHLSLAYLRVAETENCIHHRNGESCIFPIQGGGVHQKPLGSRQAIEHLTILLKRNPEHVTARWLLNIAYMTLGEYPDGVPSEFLIPPETFETEETFPRFANVAADLRLDTLSLAGGCIIDDFDNDGDLDIVTSSYDTAGQLRYFRNEGVGSFAEQTEAAHLLGLFGGLNIVQADYDNDGDIDIFVLRGAWFKEQGRHPNSLLQNDGQGRFEDVTFDVGLGDALYPTQTAAWADFDNDGDLDLFVGNESHPCQLFENRNDGTFIDVAQQAGVDNQGFTQGVAWGNYNSDSTRPGSTSYGFTKGVVWGDYNSDRFPDLYVSNMGGPNRLYRNNGDKTFTDVAQELEVTEPHVSFPVWFWDFNNDGVLDLYVFSYGWEVWDIAADYLNTDVRLEPDCLYQGDGHGGFENVTVSMNVNRATQPMGANFGDLDNDGFPDFYLGTGNWKFEALMPNLMFHNRGGTGFSDVTVAGGFGHLQKGHGVAFADIDHDGDQDVFSQLGGAFPYDVSGDAVYKNPGFENHFLVVKLQGTQSNRAGVGARIRVEILEDGGRRSVFKWVNSGGSFGANPLRQHLGLGRATNIELLEVYWPTSDLTQTFHDVAVDQFLEITEGNNTFRTIPWKTVSSNKDRDDR